MNNNQQTKINIFQDAIEKEAIRVLSLMDRESFSPTYGCLDRTFWAWKFTDFPGARFQEGLYFLSFIFTNSNENTGYFNHPKLQDWISGGFDFWAKIQYKGGEFDEAYPFEHSLAATAFSLFYLSEAWYCVKDSLPTETANRFKSATQKAADWLNINDEKHGFLSNHLAAAAAALFHAYKITGEEKFEKRSVYFLNKILDRQSEEGWYTEYGGADPGYQTHGSFYLARYYELNPSKELLSSLSRSFKFLAHFIHPDGSIGGEYTSRNTQTYYPAAFEMMSDKDGTAYWIAKQMRPSIENLAAAGLGTVDIYNYFPLLNNYVFALRNSLAGKKMEVLPAEPKYTEEIFHFPKAGIIKVKKPDYELYIGANKGGVLKAFNLNSKRLILNDCGYMGKFKNGSLFSNQSVTDDSEIEIKGNEIFLKGYFYKIKRPVLNPISFLGFRAFSLTLGRIRWISYWLKSLLVKVLIYKKNRLPLYYERHILCEERTIYIRDKIQGAISKSIEKLSSIDVFTTIHMGSSRYFIPNELDYKNDDLKGIESEIDVSKLEEGIIIEKSIKV